MHDFRYGDILVHTPLEKAFYRVVRERGMRSLMWVQRLKDGGGQEMEGHIPHPVPDKMTFRKIR